MVKQNCFALKKFYFIETLISSISLKQENRAMVKRKCLYKVLGTLITSLSLQQEKSAMVKQKCLYKVLLHRNSVTFYFIATRKQCNGETGMSL